MTATAAVNGAYSPISESNAIPAYLHRKLAANAQVGRGQFATVSLSTGFAALNDGTVPGQASAGSGDPSVLSDTDATAGNAQVRLSQRWIKGVPASTISQDGFADTDFGVPFWIKDENTPGKLSNSGGSNRSLGGVVFGLGDDSNPILWDGPVAWLLARAALMADNKIGAWHQIADAAAGTATTEIAVTREKMHGVVTGITFTGDAVVADNTDFDTITISKRDGAGGAAVVLGTYDTRAANQGAVTQHVPAAFSLSAVAGALNVLETDIVTITVVKAGAGKALRGTFRVLQKVI